MSNVYCLSCHSMIVTASEVSDGDNVKCPFCGVEESVSRIGETHTVSKHMMFEGEFIL